MKKVLLSLGVIAIFVVYSLTQRHNAADTNVATATPPSTTSGGQAASSAGSSSAGSNSSDSTGSGSATYQDGTYTGSVANAFYGNVQVTATISGGRITAVSFLDAPHDNENSVSINGQAKPLLQQEAIQAQSAHVDVVSGATQTSQAFVQSLSSALSRAEQS